VTPWSFPPPQAAAKMPATTLMPKKEYADRIVRAICFSSKYSKTRM
jgi:hypothetical protein